MCKSSEKLIKQIRKLESENKQLRTNYNRVDHERQQLLKVLETIADDNCGYSTKEPECELRYPDNPSSWCWSCVVRFELDKIDKESISCSINDNTLIDILVRLFGWKDRSYVHAIMHIENAVNNLRADLSVEKREVEKLKRLLGRCENCGEIMYPLDVVCPKCD